MKVVRLDCALVTMLHNGNMWSITMAYSNLVNFFQGGSSRGSPKSILDVGADNGCASPEVICAVNVISNSVVNHRT